MSSTEVPSQCADPGCTRSLDDGVEGHCQKCERPIHSDCGVVMDEGAPDAGRVCQSCNEPEARQTAGPAKRRRLDLSEKVRALDMLDSGATPQQVADEFGSSKRAIMRMKKEGDVIRSLSESGVRGSMKSRKQSHPAKYAALEARVAQVLEVSQGNRISITQDLVRSCSRKVREEMLKNASMSPGESKDLEDFNPTDFWIKAFARRHNVKLASRAWQPVAVSNEEKYSTEIQTLKSLLQRYDPECILSVHEATLFHKMLPRKSYLTPQAGDAGSTSMVFPPDMETKDRVTLVFCTNATGTLKVPLTLVGRTKQPQCFRIRPCPLPYLSQENTWFDVSTFRQWFSEVLLPAVRKHSWKNVALLVENVIEQNIVEDSRGQVKIFRLPPDSRPKRHPMEQGIMTTVKQKYRYAMLERVLELVPVRDAIQGCSARKSMALRGLDDGHDPNVLDTAEILHVIWGGTSEQSIARSWVKTSILPDNYNASLTAKHGKSQAFGKAEMLMETCTVQEKETIERMSALIRSRSLRVRDGSTNGLLAIVNAINSMNERDLETWLGLEERVEIKAALIREAQDTLLASATGHLSNGRSEQGGDGVDDEHSATEHLQLLPSLASIAELFVPLEELVSVCESGDAARHLRQAKRILFAAKIKEMGSAAYQPPRMNSFSTSFPQP